MFFSPKIAEVKSLILECLLSKVINQNKLSGKTEIWKALLGLASKSQIVILHSDSTYKKGQN